MNVTELGRTLSRMYRDAPKGDAVVMIHLFGVKYADEINECKCSRKDIVRAASINDSYATEVGKGVNLARFVTVR